MLICKTYAFAKSKTLLTLTLLIVCVVYFTQASFANNKRIKKGNIVTYNGNVIEFTKLVHSGPDTTTVVNPETGEETIKISVRVPAPIKLNGKEIYHETELEIMKKKGENVKYAGLLNTTIFEYLLNNMKDELKKLDNGSYQMDMNNIIVDTKGKVVYYETEGIFGLVIPPTQKEIINKIDILMDTCPVDKPAYVNNSAVPCMLNHILFNFTIKNGKVESLY